MRRLLFVDDEPGIRQTLPPILEMHSFEVTSCATVAEALQEITKREFDVLISDLNIGEPGDGFTVVSAMRRVHPKCRTFIITGYPAFETALVAIRAQVDDYIVKPANIPDLISTIEATLESESKKLTPTGGRLSHLFRDRTQEVVSKTLALLKADPKIGSLKLTDRERVDHIPGMLRDLAEMLESKHPDLTPPSALHSAAERGILRRKQGYTIDMVVSEKGLLVRAINDVIQENLLALDLSTLMTDLKWLDESVFLQLEETVKSFSASKALEAA